MKKIILIIIILAIAIVVITWKPQNINPDILEDIDPILKAEIESKADLIRLETPLPNSTITSPLNIKGEARGVWFFEASFPIYLTDWDGLIIAEGYATAQSDPANPDDAGWMTTEFVPFTATLTFENPAYKNNGSLILRKDNPSGLPEHDDALEIPIFFGQ